LIFHLVYNWFTIGLQLVYNPIDLKLLLNQAHKALPRDHQVHDSGAWLQHKEKKELSSTS